MEMPYSSIEAPQYTMETLNSTAAETRDLIITLKRNFALSFYKDANFPRVLFHQVLQKCQVPENGIKICYIAQFLNFLASQDRNNDPHQSKVGEREARLGSELVAQIHFRMGHGLGRSGDLLAYQPKAVGSSFMGYLANRLALDMIQFLGVPNTKSCVITPVATGMTLMLCMQYLRSIRSDSKFVLWSRVDQKSCFKSILTAGLIPVIIDCIIKNGILTTDTEEIIRCIHNIGTNHIVCVITTTSCFAPRGHDDIDEVARLCYKYNIPHVINNAYGIQSSMCMDLIEKTSTKENRRVDFFVGSLDKNFMVPVGGAIIASFNNDSIKGVAAMYPGRSSSVQSRDFLITVLEFGKMKFREMLQDRYENFKHLKQKILEFGSPKNLALTPHNEISVALYLDTNQFPNATELGGILFNHSVSGVRVVDGSSNVTINGYNFNNWGTHTNQKLRPYLVAAAAIGVTREEIDAFIVKLKNEATVAERRAVEQNICVISDDKYCELSTDDEID